MTKEPTDALDQATTSYREYKLLTAAVQGIYKEFDKLTKKAPNGALTDLAVKKVNFIINDVKALIEGDRYVDRIEPFVPAGQNPVHSDVLLVASELEDALRRFASKNARTWSRANLIESFEVSVLERNG